MLLLRQQFYDLSKVVDPHTKLNFSDDTILNSNNNKQVFSEVLEVLDALISTGVSLKQLCGKNKYNFYLTDEQKSLISYSSSPIPISTFVHSLNELIKNTSIKKLHATQITNWLVKNEYLKNNVHEDGKVFRVLTTKSELIGMTSESKVNSYGRKYDVNLYNDVAQKFIIDHLELILNEYDLN